ncbi:uncharacterized protein LOC141574405 [Camelus bactrianus]|uniref:Uncharacterized protein LOC141574405 n=1 Tax=Camelus bactrianus TaxID=9837 RepID=A0AC58P7Q2_CAMBA
MSRNETAPDTHGLSTDKPQMCSQGHRASARERDSVHAESGSSAAHRQGRRHEQERDSSRHSRTEHGQTSDVSGSRKRRESAVSPASDSERSEQDGGRQAVTTQGRSGSTSRHQQEGSHGQVRVSSRHSDSQQGHRASPRERDSVHAESGSSAAHRQGRRHEQERDSSRHSRTEHGQTSDVSGSRRRRESAVSPASDSERSEQNAGRQAVTTQGRSGSTSRHQQEGSHGQARVSSRHSDSQQGHRASPRERDSVHAESGSSAAHRQGRRHEQERDSSRHSRTEHGQTSDVSGSRRHPGSSDVQFSDSEGNSQVGGRQSAASYRTSGSRSRNETHGTFQGWRHGSYGNADYDYGESGYGHFHGGVVRHDSNRVSFRDRSQSPSEYIRSNITASNIHPGLKSLGFHQFHRYFY